MNDYKGIEGYYDSRLNVKGYRSNDIEYYFQATLNSKRILEVGSATGRIALNLSGDEAKVVGLEVSDVFVQLARAKLSRSGLERSHSFINCPVEKYEPSMTFDHVIMPYRFYSCLYTSELKQEVLRRVYKWLEVNGVFTLDIETLVKDKNMLSSVGKSIEVPFVHRNKELVEISTLTHFDQEDVIASIKVEVFDLDSKLLGESIFKLKYPYLHDVINDLESVGFQVESVNSSYNGLPIDVGTNYVINCIKKGG